MIACAYIPYFAPVVLHERDTLVVIRHFKRRGKVIALSPEAERMGARLEMTVSRARAICPKARFVSTAAPEFEDAQEKLFDKLWTFTNRVEIDADAYPHHAIAYLDLGSLRDADACLMAEEIARALRQAFGVGAAVGVARGKLTALLAAHTVKQDQTILVGRDDESAFIAPYSVKTLSLTKDEARRLHLLGIETLGDLAAIPRGAVAAGFGKRGTLLHQLASGLDGRPVMPAKMPQQESARASFEPLLQREHLDFYLMRLTEGLARTLDKRAVASHRLVLTVQFERGAAQTETLRLLDPATSVKALREGLDKLLTRMQFDQPIIGVEICTAHLVPAMPTQLELFGDRPISRGVIDLTRILAERYGSDDFYTAASTQSKSLILERRVALRRVEWDTGS